MMSDLGQLGLVRTTGFSSWLIRFMTHSHYNHVVTRVSEHNVVSAEIDGVQVMPVTEFQGVVWSRFPLTDRQQAKIIAFSLAQVGKPYGKLTYIWIGVALLLRVRTPRWFEKRLDNGTTYICSQLADSAYQHAGIHLFRDDRPEGAVTPASLAKIFYDFGWTDQT